jgi:hypothetical protein
LIRAPTPRCGLAAVCIAGLVYVERLHMLAWITRQRLFCATVKRACNGVGSVGCKKRG